MRTSSRRVAYAVTLVLFGCATCPKSNVPTRAGEKLAQIELELNNTPTQSDDYVLGTTPLAGRIHVLNGSDFATPVAVTLKNLDFQTAPALVLASSGTPSLSSLDLDLPLDGSWVPFVVAGAAAQLSARDKDAVIEVLERRADGIVLGRKSLMVATTSPVAASVPPIEISIGETAETIDDYLTWRPVRATVRLAAPSATDVPVTIQNMTPVTAGKLVFGDQPVVDTDIHPPVMTSSVSLTLPANGHAVSFYIAGDFGHPSVDDKDAVMEVVRASDNALLGREGVMIRIRKDANLLNANERARYVNSVARLNLALGRYMMYVTIHKDADSPFYPGHQGPAFLAWHRVYVLRYERELQAIDPAVALHYWRFDVPAPNVFDSLFIGGPPNASGIANLDASNPLSAWVIDGFTGLQRSPRFAPTQTPTTWGVLTESATLALGGSGAGANYAAFRGMEGNPHGNVHSLSSWFGGWMGVPATAVRDPLFFLLHSNVERLWAKWQVIYGRKDPAVAESYSPTGSFPGIGGIRIGHFERDSMWPWDGRTGLLNPAFPLSQRPATAPDGPMPVPVGGWGPPLMPRPNDVIDFDHWTLFGFTGLAYAYDDVPFVP